MQILGWFTSVQTQLGEVPSVSLNKCNVSSTRSSCLLISGLSACKHVSAKQVQWIIPSSPPAKSWNVKKRVQTLLNMSDLIILEDLTHQSWEETTPNGMQVVFTAIFIIGLKRSTWENKACKTVRLNSCHRSLWSHAEAGPVFQRDLF